MTDGRHTYCRQPEEGAILYNHTANACNFTEFEKRDTLARAELGVFLNHTHDVPHFRIPSKSKHHHNAPDFNPIYDVVEDPEQQNPIHDADLENRLAAKMKDLLDHYDAPECQYSRVGL
jgi:hypothetical protein